MPPLRRHGTKKDALSQRILSIKKNYEKNVLVTLECTHSLSQLCVSVTCGLAEFLLDADELVVLGHTVGAAH